MLLPVPMMMIVLQKEVLVSAVCRECHRCDSQARKGAPEPIRSREFAFISPRFPRHGQTNLAASSDTTHLRRHGSVNGFLDAAARALGSNPVRFGLTERRLLNIHGDVSHCSPFYTSQHHSYLVTCMLTVHVLSSQRLSAAASFTSASICRSLTFCRGLTPSPSTSSSHPSSIITNDKAFSTRITSDTASTVDRVLGLRRAISFTVANSGCDEHRIGAHSVLSMLTRESRPADTASRTSCGSRTCLRQCALAEEAI